MSLNKVKSEDKMKKRSIFIALMIILIISGCTKKVATYEQVVENGIRITKNTGVPADSTFKIELKEVGFIDIGGEENPENLISFPKSFDFDDAGNLYILDYEKRKIHKFNNKFERVSIFGGKGQGPGEFVEASSVIVKGDTLIVPDSRSWKINKLDLDGKFISDKKYTDYQKTPFDIIKYGTGYVSKFFGMSSDETGQRFSLEFVSYFDSNLNYVKDVYNFKELYVENQVEDPSADGSVHTANDKNLYLSINSKTDYKIDVYDLNGVKKRIIRKNFARIKNSEKAIKEQEVYSAKYGLKFRTEFLNSIYRLHTDKYGRLWVSSSNKEEEKGSYYDIFLDDIYLKRMYLDIDKEYGPIYIGEKIICMNWKDNSLKIYEY